MNPPLNPVEQSDCAILDVNRPIARRIERPLYHFIGPLSIKSGKKHIVIHSRVRREAEECFASLVPDEEPSLRKVIPRAEVRCSHGQLKPLSGVSRILGLALFRHVQLR